MQWVPDLFMKRVENNEEWTLMCPNECPGLYDCHGGRLINYMLNMKEI